MPKPKSQLSPKQQRFIEEYPVDFNASAAAIRAGYSAKTAGAAGHNNLKNEKIQRSLGRHIKRLADKAEVTVERVLKEYARLAFFDIAELFDESGNMLPLQDMPVDARRAIGGIDVSQIGDEEVVKKIKIIDKRGALDSLSKYLKMFADVNITVTAEDLGDKIKRARERKTRLEAEGLRAAREAMDEPAAS